MTQWMLYILKCGDNSLYTGITNNLTKRITDHENGNGAKYTRNRGPFELVYSEKHENRSLASKREFEIKKMSRADKENLIKQGR